MSGKEVPAWPHKAMLRCLIVLVVFLVVLVDMAVQNQCSKLATVALRQALADINTNLPITAVTKVEIAQRFERHEA